MSKIAAIEIGIEETRILAAEASDNRLTLTHYYCIPFSEEPTKEISSALEEIDSSFALINSSSVIYREIELPFNDKKKIEKTAPLQLQDQLPIDIENFTLDSIVTGSAKEGGYKIITSAAPSDTIARTLEHANKLGLDPKLVTSKASSLTTLKSVFYLHGSFAIIEAAVDMSSLAIFVDDNLVLLREISTTDKNSSNIETICCLERHNIETVYFIGSHDNFNDLKSKLQQNVTELDLSKIITNKSSQDLSVENISWAVGLLSTEISSNKSILDFRVGDFASRHLLKNILAGLKEEAVFIGLAVACAILWIGSQYYRASSGLNSVDNRISEISKAAIPGETIPKRNELETLETKLAELEEQLGGMGSLSSLSPLESLRELSKIITNEIQIDIDTLNIAESKISFRGTVADTPTVGKLSTALESNEKVFCSIKVDPSGRVPGSSRVRFSAEIDLCE